MILPLHDETDSNPNIDEVAARRFDDFATATGARIREFAFKLEDNNGEYHVEKDEILIRERSQWSTRPMGYYYSLSHELIHWTAPRLGRYLDSVFGDPNWAIEELTAEYGAVRLTKHFGVYAPRPGGNKIVADYLTKISDHQAALERVESEVERAVAFLLESAQKNSSSLTGIFRNN
jgi:antirestriction protein ArdC